MKAAVQELPEQAGIQLANWYWKGVRQFVWERFGTSLSRSSCLNWLHRLGFAGNPDSPQAVVFLTSIIDELVSVETYYVHYHVGAGVPQDA